MMKTRQPFLRHTGVAAVFMQDNIDTDQIIPSREMVSVSRNGLGVGLFAGQRYLSSKKRTPNPDFVLNAPAYRDASIFLSGMNFGCGSSREHAVWALEDFGIRVIIAQSFGEIFQSNCARNGVCAISLGAEEIEQLADYVSHDPQENRLIIDLEKKAIQTSTGAKLEFYFEVDPYHLKLLLEGIDPIGLTLKMSQDIDQFIVDDSANRPWLYTGD